jgi:hypothetical protein
MLLPWHDIALQDSTKIPLLVLRKVQGSCHVIGEPELNGKDPVFSIAFPGIDS